MKEEISAHSQTLFKGIEQLIASARGRIAIFVNAETTMLYWQIGDYINKELLKGDRGIYRTKNLATLSQDLRPEKYQIRNWKRNKKEVSKFT